MTPKQAFTDEELTAFLDGEAPAELCQNIEAQMSPELEARMALLDRGKEQAIQAFAAALNHAPDCDLSESAVPHPGTMRPAAVFGGLGLVAGLVLALGLGTWFGQPADTSAEPWHVEVAAYHALYVEQTLNAANMTAEENAQRLQALSAVLGRDLSAAAEIEDLKFVRAQQLGFEGAPLIQMAFLADDGTPVALCILRQQGGAQDVAQTNLKGMSGASWADNNLRFFLIGGNDGNATKRQADAFHALLVGA